MSTFFIGVSIVLGALIVRGALTDAADSIVEQLKRMDH